MKLKQCALIVLCAAALCANGQNVTIANAQRPTTPQISIQVLYLHFFLREAYIENLPMRDAVSSRQSISEQMRKRIGLSTEQWAKVKEASFHIANLNRNIEAQESVLRTQIRQAHEAGGGDINLISAGAMELNSLKRNRDGELTRCVSNLKASIGGTAGILLDHYVQTEIAKHMSVVMIPSLSASESVAHEVSK